MRATLLHRILAAVGTAAAIATGIYLSGGVERESMARVERLREEAVSARDAQRLALARQLSFKQKEGYFEAELEADFQAFDIAPISMDALKQPNKYFHEISEPVVVNPGRSLSTAHFRIHVAIERVNFRKSGATVGTRHVVATVRNTSTTPIAYFLHVVSARRGHCKVRGARMHNAMALLPGESAEVVVCAGGGAVKVEDLRVLEITPIGHAYVSKVPPVAVGHDPVSGQAHVPHRRLPICSKTPSTRLGNLIKQGRAEWRDIMDFYARHNCERFQFFSGYTIASEPVERLPALRTAPGDGASAP